MTKASLRYIRLGSKCFAGANYDEEISLCIKKLYVIKLPWGTITLSVVSLNVTQHKRYSTQTLLSIMICLNIASILTVWYCWARHFLFFNRNVECHFFSGLRLSAFTLSTYTLSAVTLSAIMLSAITMGVFMPSVIMLSFVYVKCHKADCHYAEFGLCKVS